MRTRWGLALRLARRLVMRAPARSALIAVLVAVPVIAGTFALVTVSTARLSPGEAADRYLGHADAAAQVTSYRQVRPLGSAFGRGQTYSGEPATVEDPVGRGTRNAGEVSLAALLPAGARLVPAANNQLPTTVTAGRRSVPVNAVPVDLTDPISANLFSLQSGHVPNSSGEIAVTTPLAHRLNLSPGSRVSLGRFGPMTVAGVVRDPRNLADDEVVAPLSTFGGMASFAKKEYGDPIWLIDFPGSSAAPDLHDALAAHGIIYETRGAWEHPSAELRFESSHVGSQVVAVLASIIGFGIAEIVLLAGTAFAVGTRRQIRELGLLRAAGGDDRDVQRVVVAQALVLGVLGAFLGVAVGVLAVFFARPGLETFTGVAFGRLDARPLPILGVTLIGIVAALLAAIVPARTSGRSSVLDMMRTRFPVASGVVRTPRWARLALVAGPLIVIGAAIAWHNSHDNGGPQAALSVSVDQVAHAFTQSSQDARWTTLISIGAAVTLAGLARSCATLLTRLGHIAHRLPLSLRLAVRDAARHRHRSAPATAAVATVIAGAVMTVFVASSTDLRNERAYRPYIPVGKVLISGPDAADVAADVQLARQKFAIDAVGSLGILNPPKHSGSFARLGGHARGCTSSDTQDCLIGRVNSADPAALELIVGRPVPAATETLEHGGIVVLAPDLFSNGTAAIDLITGEGRPQVTTTTLPATYVPGTNYYDGIAPLLVSPATAKAHGWRLLAQQALLQPRHPLSTAQADTLSTAALERNTGVFVGEPYHGGLGLPLLILIAATAIAALAGTSIAVALAMAEARSDLATLAAVGASPSRRRVQAMAQAAAVGGLGSLLGLGLGALVGIALLQGSVTYPFTLPLSWLALLVVAAPVLAIAVAGAATRSRLPMTRRLG